MTNIKAFLEKHYVLKRFLRVFLNAFLVTGFTFVETFGGVQNIISSFQKSIGDGFSSLGTIFLLPLIMASTTGGLAAIAKYIRDNYQDYKSKILKLVGNIF
jgi:hypothetical protein